MPHGGWNRLDLNGFLRLTNVLSPSDLAAAQAAAQNLIDAAHAQALPPGWSWSGSGFFRDAFAFHRDLEQLALHPSTWPIILELTGRKPQLRRGTMIHDHPQQNPQMGGLLHSAREAPDHGDILGSRSVLFERVGDELRCSNFLVFWYLDDVLNAADGGLICVAGSHKSQFVRPDHMFGTFGGANHPDSNASPAPIEATVPEGAVHAACRAGDAFILTEATSHGVLPWRASGQRRVLALRYTPHGMHGLSSRHGLSPEVRARLAPETLELCAYPHEMDGETKAIASRARIQLPPASKANVLGHASL